MSIGEPKTFAGNAIDVRGGNFSTFGIKALDVSITQIVSVDDDDIGGPASEAGEEQRGENRK
jgi:hypothetical protein